MSWALRIATATAGLALLVGLAAVPPRVTAVVVQSSVEFPSRVRTFVIRYPCGIHGHQRFQKSPGATLDAELYRVGAEYFAHHSCD